jgi:hypothetical protein
MDLPGRRGLLERIELLAMQVLDQGVPEQFVEAALYNLITSLTGGIEVMLRETD